MKVELALKKLSQTSRQEMMGAWTKLVNRVKQYCEIPNT
jgi:hypothetical protein